MRMPITVSITLLALWANLFDPATAQAREAARVPATTGAEDFSPLSKPGFETEDSGTELRVHRSGQSWQTEHTLRRKVVDGERESFLPITLMGRRIVAPDENTAIRYFLTIPGFDVQMRHQKEGIASSPVLPHVFYAGQPTWSIEATLTRMVSIGDLPLVLRVMDKPTFRDYLQEFEAYHRRHTRTLRIDHIGDAEQRMIPQALWLQRVQSLLVDQEADLHALVGGGDLFIPNAYSDVTSSDAAVRSVLTEVALAQGFDRETVEAGLSMAAVPLALNEIGLEAAGIGNHEGDKGSRGLARMVSLSRFPWVVSNAELSGSAPFEALVGTDGDEVTELAGRVVRWTTIPGTNGQDLGFITLLTPLAAGITKLEDVRIEPETVEVGGVRRPVRDDQGIAPVQAVLDELWQAVIQPIVRQMQARGIDVIVLSDHLQQSLYSRIMMEKSEGIDLWISNGSGNLFWGNRALPLNQGLEIGDIYPAWHESLAGEPVALLAGGDEGVFYSMFLGEVDALGRLLPHRTHPMTGPWPANREGIEALEGLTGRTAETTPRLEALVGALQGAVESIDSVSLIYTDQFLRGGSKARGTEKYPLQDLMADALLSTAASYDLRYADGSRRVPRLSIINDGGNRDSLGSFLDADGRESYGFGQEVPVLGRQREDGTVLREPGWISPLHVNRVFSFNDEVVVVDLKARELVDWFGWGVGRLDPSSAVHPGEFLHLSGAVYGFDEERPSPWTRDDVEPGVRITYLSIWDPVAGSWETVVETDSEGNRVWRVPEDQLFTAVMRDFTLRRGIEGGTPGDNLPELDSMSDGTGRPVLLSSLPQPEPRLDFLVPAREQLIISEHLLRLRDMGRAIDDELLDYRARMESSTAPPALAPFHFLGFDEPYRLPSDP